MKQETYRVYILDDDEEDAALLVKAFEKTEENSEVDWFNTPNKLLQKLFFLPLSEVPHLILMDHQMPLMNGSNLVKHIRGDQKLIDTTVGVYSSTIQPCKLQDMFKCGIDFFIEKATTEKEMKHHIKKFWEAIEVRQLNG